MRGALGREKDSRTPGGAGSRVVRGGLARVSTDGSSPLDGPSAFPLPSEAVAVRGGGALPPLTYPKGPPPGALGQAAPSSASPHPTGLGPLPAGSAAAHAGCHRGRGGARAETGLQMLWLLHTGAGQVTGSSCAGCRRRRRARVRQRPGHRRLPLLLPPLAQTARAGQDGVKKTLSSR